MELYPLGKVLGLRELHWNDEVVWGIWSLIMSGVITQLGYSFPITRADNIGSCSVEYPGDDDRICSQGWKENV